MSTDLISIIVPVYNVEKYFDRCMKSLLNQTYKDIEIILVDDESPDSCPQKCDYYARIDQRVKVIHKHNEGLGVARNSGLQIAKGKYVAFVDSDDYVTLNMCDVLYKAASFYNADVVYGNVYYDNNGDIINKKNSGIQIWEGNQVMELLLDLIATTPKCSDDTVMEVSVWKALFKKSIFDDHNIKFVSERSFISEDVIFDIDFISKSKKIVLIPDPVYYYCVNPNSLSKSFRTDRFHKVKILYYEIKRKLLLLYEKETVELRCDRFLIARARTNAKQIIKHKKVIGSKKTLEGLEAICNDDELISILKRYPIYKLPVKYAIVALCMKYKLYFILEVLFFRG